MSDGAGSSSTSPDGRATDRYDGRQSRSPICRTAACSDVIVANQRGPLLMYRNEVAPGRRDGIRSRRSLPVDAASTGCTNRGGRARSRVLERPAAGPGGSGGSGFCAQNTAASFISASGTRNLEQGVVRGRPQDSRC